jgi:hypothetical protein
MRVEKKKKKKEKSDEVFFFYVLDLHHEQKSHTTNKTRQKARSTPFIETRHLMTSNSTFCTLFFIFMVESGRFGSTFPSLFTSHHPHSIPYIQ